MWDILLSTPKTVSSLPSRLVLCSDQLGADQSAMTLNTPRGTLSGDRSVTLDGTLSG